MQRFDFILLSIVFSISSSVLVQSYIEVASIKDNQTRQVASEKISETKQVLKPQSNTELTKPEASNKNTLWQPKKND